MAWQPVQSQVALRLPDQDATLVQAQARFVKAGMSRAAKAVKSEPHPDRVHVLTTFAQILAFKQVARALLKPQTEAAGVEALRQALELEIALAAFADARGIEL